METAMKPIKRPTMLSATFVETVNVPGRYGDGRGGLGLSLLVRPGSRRRSGRGAPTFAEAADKVMAIHAGNWKPGGRTEDSWRSTLRDYILPRLGDMRVDAVTGGAHRPADEVAVAQGHRPDNPAGEALAAALPNSAGRRVHHKALPQVEVDAALRKVSGSDAYRGAVLALELLVLTATRPGEVHSGLGRHRHGRRCLDDPRGAHEGRPRAPRAAVRPRPPRPRRGAAGTDPRRRHPVPVPPPGACSEPGP